MRIRRTSRSTRHSEKVVAWCIQFEKECRARAIRVTPQRLAVYRALAEDLAHPTAEAVYNRLGKQLPGLSQATIYRTLQFLEDEKLIRRVSSPRSIGRFDANVGPHQHLLCRVCGKLEDVSIPALHKAAIPSVPGFKVEELDIRLVGKCDACSRAEFKNRKRKKPASGK